MTDSTADNNASDGAFEVGPSADELFGEIEESFEGEPSDRESEETSTGGDSIEDRTAADVFAQLRSDVGDDADEVLSDESPEDIIASADDPDPEPEVDEALVVDEDALEDLLLTGRTKEQEFLWVDVDDESETTDATDATAPSADSESAASAPDDTEPSIAEPEADSDAPAGEDRAETVIDAESAAGGDGPTVTPFAGDEDVKRAFGDEGTDTDSRDEDGAPTEVESADEPPTEAVSTNETDVEDDGGSAALAGDGDEAVPDSESDANAAEEPEPESDETSMVVKDEEEALATTDGESSSGILGWLRSKFGNLL